MKNRLCELTGAEFPLFAFSHCRDVVAAVSRAGGFGVLGGSGFTPEGLEEELRWIDEHCGGKPYGVDIVIPENQKIGAGFKAADVAKDISQKHRDFTAALLNRHGVDATPEQMVDTDVELTTSAEHGEALLDVAFRHPIRLIANALGLMPDSMLSRAKAHGVPTAALVGAREHAERQVAAGVDIIVAQGTEAGGHCGEVSTMVLVPEVIRAVGPGVPVLAAGGIMTGQQMAGAMAMGAQGVWTGSIWLATTESETSEPFREKMVEARSRDTIRSTYRTGKPSRQLKSSWHDAWHGPDSPGPLPLPHMTLVSIPAFRAIDRAADAGKGDARKLVSYFVGQGVGLVDSVRSATAVVQTFKEEFAEAIGGLMDTLQD